MLRQGLLLALLTSLASEESIAIWAFGDGTSGGTPVAIGSPVESGSAVSAGAQPVRLELIGMPGCDLILRPGTQARLRRDPLHPQRVILDLEHGAVQADLIRSGAEHEVDIRGVALSVSGHDSLFLVERDGPGSDYVAVVSGQAMARIRPDLRVDDGGMAILLQARQGLRCTATTGLAEVDQLDQRPQLLGGSLLEQGRGSDASHDWTRDEASLASADPVATGELTRLPEPPPTVVAQQDPTPTEPPPVVETPRLEPEPPPAIVVAAPTPPPPPPPPAAAVVHSSRPGEALLDALAEEHAPGWQRRGRIAPPRR